MSSPWFVSLDRGEVRRLGGGLSHAGKHLVKAAGSGQARLEIHCLRSTLFTAFLQHFFDILTAA